MSDRPNRLAIIYMIGNILSSMNKHQTASDIQTELFNVYEVEVPKRSIKQYLIDMDKMLNNPFDIKRGRHGGYAMNSEWKKRLIRLSSRSLSPELKNGINDAFELALKSSTFHYYKDLKEAQALIGTNDKWKTNDFEYYIGKERHDHKVTRLLKEIKQAIVDHKYILMSSKYDYFGIPKEEIRIKPLYIVHDQDESFLIAKNEKRDYIYQNLLNIKKMKVTEDNFIMVNEESIDSHVNDYALKVKGEHNLKFTINTERGMSIYNLWNFEFRENKGSTNKKKDITFFEEYKVHEFLLRMQPHITISFISDKVKNEWNEKVYQIKAI